MPFPLRPRLSRSVGENQVKGLQSRQICKSSSPPVVALTVIIEIQLELWAFGGEVNESMQ